MRYASFKVSCEVASRARIAAPYDADSTSVSHAVAASLCRAKSLAALRFTLAVMLSTMGLLGCTRTERKTGPAEVAGRFVIDHSPHVERDTILLDTATGQTWYESNVTDLTNEPMVWEPAHQLNTEADWKALRAEHPAKTDSASPSAENFLEAPASAGEPWKKYQHKPGPHSIPVPYDPWAVVNQGSTRKPEASGPSRWPGKRVIPPDTAYSADPMQGFQRVEPATKPPS